MVDNGHWEKAVTELSAICLQGRSNPSKIAFSPGGHVDKVYGRGKEGMEKTYDKFNTRISGREQEQALLEAHSRMAEEEEEEADERG
jgi:hypothetical protein